MGAERIERLKMGTFRMRRVLGYLLMAASMLLIVFMAFRAFFAWLMEETGLRSAHRWAGHRRGCSGLCCGSRARYLRAPRLSDYRLNLL